MAFREILCLTSLFLICAGREVRQVFDVAGDQEATPKPEGSFQKAGEVIDKVVSSVVKRVKSFFSDEDSNKQTIPVAFLDGKPVNGKIEVVVKTH